MSTRIVLNPAAGGGGELDRTVAMLLEHPALAGAEVRVTDEEHDARFLAREAARSGYRRVVAAGGDGTVNGVVNGLAEEGGGPVLGVLPLGTGNDLARSLGIPRDLEDALEALARAGSRPMDLLRITRPVERWAANASAGGMSGEVDEALDPEVKEAWGPLAYIRSALEVVADPPVYRVALSGDGGEPWEGEAVNVLVANGRTVAGGIPAAPTALLDDGLLDVVVVKAATLGALAGFASLCILGKHLDHELVVHRRVTSLEVRSDPPMPFNVDGELVGETPLDVALHPRALQVLAGPDAPALGGS